MAECLFGELSRFVSLSSPSLSLRFLSASLLEVALCELQAKRAGERAEGGREGKEKHRAIPFAGEPTRRATAIAPLTSSSLFSQPRPPPPSLPETPRRPSSRLSLSLPLSPFQKRKISFNILLIRLRSRLRHGQVRSGNRVDGRHAPGARYEVDRSGRHGRRFGYLRPDHRRHHLDGQ